MRKRGNIVVVTSKPKCDFCDETAEFDARTIWSAWANMCPYHYALYASGPGLGIGRGQKLYTKDEEVPA